MKIKVRYIVMALVLVIFAAAAGVYLYFQNTIYSPEGMKVTALHEAGHAFANEYFFPGSVKRVGIKYKPGIKGIIFYLRTGGEETSKSPDGYTLSSTENKMNLPEREYYFRRAMCLHAGYISAMALADNTNQSIMGMYGAMKDNTDSYEHILMVLKIDGVISSDITDINKVTGVKAEGEKAEIFDKIREEVNKVIKENSKSVNLIAEDLLKRNDKTLTGDEVRNIINTCKGQ